MSGSYRVDVGSQSIELPIVELPGGVTIALLMTIDEDISFIDTAGRELAEALRDTQPDIIVTAATLGIPVAIEVARALGHERYIVLQKSKKYHLRSSPTVEYTSITTAASQQLTIDERHVHLVRGRRVAFVDDVISSGSSARAALQLIADQGGEIVAVGALLTEGDEWRETLGDYAPLVRALGELPLNP